MWICESSIKTKQLERWYGLKLDWKKKKSRLNHEKKKRPGKKGLSLTVEDYKKLKELIPEIDSKLGL